MYAALKISFLLFVLTSANSMLHAQEKRFDHIIDFDLPKEAQYLDEQKREAFAKEKPKLRVITKLNSANLINIYRLGDIAVKVNAVSNEGTNKKDRGSLLEQTKRTHDALNADGSNPNYTSEIREISNGKVLIIHTGGLGEAYRYFLSGATPTYDKRFVISIRYEKKDAVKAKQLVDHILKNVKFK